MLTGISKQEAELLNKILLVIYNWGGISNDTPGDTEVISTDTGAVTVEELEEALIVVDKLIQQTHVQRSVNDGQKKEAKSDSPQH